MTTNTAGHKAHHKHANKWVLVDARMQLLSIGRQLFHGISPRGTLDRTGRNVLAPRLRAAALDGIERTTAANADGDRWEVRVVPVLGPILQEPLAVLGCYGPDASAFPQPPLVGAWEWEITPPGENQQMRTYWSDSLFDVYGLPRPEHPCREATWEGAQWLDEFPLEADRAQLRTLVDEALAASTDGLVLHTFNARNPSTGETHRLRFAGRSYVSEPEPPWWFRGISMRVDYLSPSAHATPGPQEFLNGVFAVTDTPLFAVETLYEHIYITTRSFSDLRLRLPAHRHIPEMCHPDDLEDVRAYLKRAASHRMTVAEPIDARFLDVDGNWRTLTLAGVGLKLSDSEDLHHVLCRVTAAHNQPQGGSPWPPTPPSSR